MEELSSALRVAFEADFPPEGTISVEEDEATLRYVGCIVILICCSSPVAPEAVNQLAERFGRLDPSDATVVCFQKIKNRCHRRR